MASSPVSVAQPKDASSSARGSPAVTVEKRSPRSPVVRTVSTEESSFNNAASSAERSASPPPPPPRGGGDWIVSAAEAMNPLCRPAMEDCCVIHAPGTWGCRRGDHRGAAYVGVYDGHGGRDVVDFCEHGLAHHVARELSDEGTEADVKTRLERAFLMTDLHAQRAGITVSGATVALCLLRRDENNGDAVTITAANVGDSRAVLGRTDGTTVRLTTDHRPDCEFERRRIAAAGGFLLKNRVCGVLAVTRSLGDFLLKPFVIAHPAVRTETVEAAGAFLIVACDGLWDVVSDEEAVRLVGNNYPKQTAADCLVQLALRRGTTDNVTAVVVWL